MKRKPGSTFGVVVLALVFVTEAAAQSVSGSVRDSLTGSPLAGAFVMLKDSAGKVLDYVAADSGGNFSIGVGTGSEGCSVEISMMGYSPRKITMPFGERYDILLAEAVLELDAVVIKAGTVRMKGDTLEYSVPALLSQDDRSISDVLKKLPGVDVSKEGRVKYQGRAISRFYIEGKDLLGSRYNVATQNIDPRDLVSIDIYENHQPVKALEGVVESSAASVNIRLKDSAKGKWVGALQAEAGGSTVKPHVPYSASAFAMFIGRGYQGINTLKTDAAGNNIIYESDPNVFIFGVDEIEFVNRYRPYGYLSVSHVLAPIDKDRTRFNTSYSVTTDHTVPMGDNAILGVGGKYERNALNSGSSVLQTYIGNDGSVKEYIDNNSMNSLSHFASGNVSLEINTPKVYLKDKFRFDYRDNGIGSSVAGTLNRVQDAGSRDMNMFNYFRFTKNTGDWVYSFDNFTQYTENGERMLVVSPEEGDTASQDIGSRILYNLLSFNNTLKIGKKAQLTFRSSVPFLYRTFRTRTEGVVLSDPEFADRLENDVLLGYVKPTERIRFEFSSGHFRLDAGADIWYQYIDYTMDIRNRCHKYAVNPSLRLKYDFGARLSAVLGGGYTMGSVDEQKIYGGLILQNFRYLSSGRTELTQNPGWNVKGELDFRDPMAGWYLDVDVSCSSSKSYQYTRYFVDEYIISYESDELTGYSVLNTDATLSKAFFGFGGKLDISGKFAMTSSDILQDETVIPYESFHYTAGLKFVSDISGWMKADYSGNYSISRYRTSGAWDDGQSHGFSQKLALSFFPHRSVTIDIAAEHYLDKYSDDNTVQMCLLDASVYYFITQKLQVFLHARNLLDTRHYAYTVLSPMNVVRYRYDLRPLNVLIGLEMKF